MDFCDLQQLPLLLLSALGVGLLLALPIFVLAHESTPAWPVRVYFAFLRVAGYSSIKRELAAQTVYPLRQQFLVTSFFFFSFILVASLVTILLSGGRWHC